MKAPEAPLGHDWMEATCQRPKTCERCALEEGILSGHSYGAWQLHLEPACMKEGMRFRACSCGVEETEALAALEHQFRNGTCDLCGQPDPDFILGAVDGD